MAWRRSSLIYASNILSHISHFLLSSMVPTRKATPFFCTTYPLEWTIFYVRNNYFDVDPVIAAGRSGWVSDIAKSCIDVGASMFVSHGAPVLQPLEIYKRRPIFYGLGNFIFHVRSEKSTWTAPEVWESIVGLCSFEDNGDLLGATFSPIVIGGDAGLKDAALERRLAPHQASGARADSILERFRAQSGAGRTASSLASVAINATGKNETTGSACAAANFRRQV